MIPKREKEEILDEMIEDDLFEDEDYMLEDEDDEFDEF